LYFPVCSAIVPFCQTFPKAKSVPKTITKFGFSFQDDYTWLEDMKSEETKNWTAAQNEVVNLHFVEIKKSTMRFQK